MPTDYLFDYSEPEIERIRRQAEMLRPITQRLLLSAGLGKGMRVLDIGCGAGDATMLVADLVGPTGHVVGIDRDAVVIGAARRRINERGLRNVEFAQYDSETIAVGLKCAFVVPKTYTGTCQQRPLGDLFDANENPAYRRTVLRSARQTRSASVCARRAREVWQLRNRRKLRRAFGGLAGSAEFSAPGALPPDGAGHC